MNHAITITKELQSTTLVGLSYRIRPPPLAGGFFGANRVASTFQQQLRVNVGEYLGIFL